MRAPAGRAFSRAARALATSAALVAVACAGAAAASEIHRCPQADGTTRFQDRPCGPESARSQTRTPEPAAAAPRRAAGGAPQPAGDPPRPDSRADYVARNQARCDEGNRRACAAVTCERSGRLDSPACQEAVGYLRGPGWELRPRSDLFDPGRAADEFTLTCRGSPRRVTLTRVRGTDRYAWPPVSAATHGAGGGSASAPEVSRAALPDAAREFCAAR